MVDDLQRLNQLKHVVEQLGYSAAILGSDEGSPFDILSVQLDEDSSGQEQYLTMTIYPLGDELEGSVFVQFFIQYPFEIAGENLSRVTTLLPGINNKLPLGHFDIADNKTNLYFKYVLALPLDFEATPEFLSDVLDMCIFAYENSFDALEASA